MNQWARTGNDGERERGGRAYFCLCKCACCMAPWLFLHIIPKNRRWFLAKVACVWIGPLEAVELEAGTAEGTWRGDVDSGAELGCGEPPPTPRCPWPSLQAHPRSPIRDKLSSAEVFKRSCRQGAHAHVCVCVRGVSSEEPPPDDLDGT